MAEFSLFTNPNTKARTSGPSGNTGLYTESKTVTFGVEFFVTKRVWLQQAALWRNNNLHTGTPTFQLYRVDSASAGSVISGGSGSMPSGNYGGWGYGRANPLALDPALRYKMAITIPNYYYITTDQFGTSDIYGNGLGSGVVRAPGTKDARSGKQGSYIFGTGYPNSEFNDSNWWIDVVVSDRDPTAVIFLNASGKKGKAGSVNLPLNASGASRKRTVKASSVTMHLAAKGFYQFSSTLASKVVLNLAANAVEVFHHSDLIVGELPLSLNLAGSASKSSSIEGVNTLELNTPQLTDFYRMTAQSIQASLLTEHWSDADGRFKQAANMDAEALSATTMGGLFLNAIRDSSRGQANIRHLRSFRVKNQDVFAPNYEGPRLVMGYKPFSELGADSHVNPPAIIDQAGSWAAVLFKMGYGEPVGDDVHSLTKWNSVRVVNDNDRSLYGGQFLSHSRRMTHSGYSVTARPTLSTAAWALLAASNIRGVFSVNPPALPRAINIVLQAVPVPAENHYRVAVSWALDAMEIASYYEVSIESKVASGTWRPVFPTTQTGPIETVQQGDRYVARWVISAPTTPSSFRVRVRLRNASAGPWGTSYSQAIPADSLAIRQFLGEDDLNQGVSGGGAWRQPSIWRWLSPGS